MAGDSTKDRFPGTAFSRREWVLAALLVFAVFLVYQPAWHGGFIWDDGAHVTRAELQSWRGLARIWFDLGRLDEASDLYRRALQVKPDLAEAHNNLGLALAGRGRTDEAIAHYEEALRLRPAYVEAHNNLGLALFARGAVQEAASHYADAIALNPNAAEPHNNLGLALARLGRLDEAVAQFERALEIWPDYPQARLNLAWARSARPSRR